MTIVRLRGPEAFLKASRLILDLLEEGRVAGINTVYGPDGVGRVSVTTIDGGDVELPGMPEDPEETTPPETPAAKEKVTP